MTKQLTNNHVLQVSEQPSDIALIIGARRR